MNLRPAFFIVLSAALAGSLPGADETPAPTTMKERLKARIAEDARKADGKKPAASTPAPSAKAAAPAANSEPGPTTTSSASTPTGTPVATPTAAATAKESPTVLPKMEVKKERITVLDQKIAEQEQAIARERKNLKATEVDVALNDSKIAKPMAIFGGESSQFRQRVASERVELLEAERDILEAMKRARTKEEKQELQKQLDELRAVRRDLEKTLR